MTDDTELEPVLRELLVERAAVRPEDLDALLEFVDNLPARRRRRGRAVLAAAAAIVVLLGFGGVLVAQLPLGTSGPAPSAPDPAAFAGDPRLAVCGVTADKALAIFEMAHLRDYQSHLPAAYELKGLQADPAAPALVIVLKGPASAGRDGGAPGTGSHDVCMVVGDVPGSWTPVAIVDVDTDGLVAILPEPTATPIADDLAPWAARCGGPEAGIFAVFRMTHASDYREHLPAMGLSPELDVADPAVVVVYTSTHPFPVDGAAPPSGTTPAPREPLAAGHRDVCILVGGDPSTAEMNVYSDVDTAGLRTSLSAGAPSSPAPSPSPSASPLPAQLDPAECERMSFAPDRCLAVVEAALGQASLDLADVERVSIAKLPSDVSLGSSPVAAVTFTLRDGTDREQDVRCGVISTYSLVCTDHPEILLIAPHGRGGGYRDVPCGSAPGGEPGSSCATPMPTIDPSAAAAAVPLEIAARDIPITSVGHLEIDLGRATLPNGILSDARFSLADPYTRAYTVAEGIALEVRSLDPSRPPFANIHEHGWYPGTENVEAYLVLDVTSVTPGAMLEVRGLIVR